ncbi:MAG: DEAD/DEAH box helicase [Candidatus Methanomethylophilus sp.]|nr:DEAD/DEAH box helicase [Methanomethylophilus sp.]
MAEKTRTFAEGQRITVRGEDFMITGIKPSDDGNNLLHAKGLSELVKDKQFVFDTAIEKDIVLIDPRKMVFIPDNYSGYTFSKLYLENAMRCNPVTSDKLSISLKGAYNHADYQLTPTWKAFQLPRPRFLIADGVGLGKTIEVGIMLTELIKRSRGKRILIVALKSILAQFQEEMWNRFALSFQRLDSYGVDKIRTKIPANKNPFEYYDRTIISIDTLKNDSKFRHYIEKTRWDIVVIDECHIVANSSSQRGNLAALLAQRCESLILTSATPHNGRSENFANLIRMIEPTAIPHSGAYDREHVKDYYVRRFKDDIEDDQVRANFQDRVILPTEVQLNELEERFLALQQAYKHLKKKEQGEKGQDVLYSVGLFKAFLSSPEAALETLLKRMDDVERSGNENDPELYEMKTILEEIIETGQNSKYLELVAILKELKWAGRPSDDRFVIFSERIATIKMLKERIMRDFKIKNEEAICSFDGSLSDVEQEALIDDFSKQDSQIRLLICSDAGSQGVNLHYYCHRMFNYDLPWSLITLEQRNGRIDRYGQKEVPYIHYLIEKTANKDVRSDLRILEVLFDKAAEVQKILGDTGSILEIISPEKEEKAIQNAIAADKVDDGLINIFASAVDEKPSGPIMETTAAVESTDMVEEHPSIFGSDTAFYNEMLHLLEARHFITREDYSVELQNDYIKLRNNEMLDRVLYDMPDEAKPKRNDDFKLTTNKEAVMEAISRSRKKASGGERKWAEFQIMYDLHPAIHYYQTCLDSCLGKDQALAAKLSTLKKGTAWFAFNGLVSNGLGQEIISEFFVIPMNVDGTLAARPLPLMEFAKKHLSTALPTSHMTDEEMERLHELLSDAVGVAVNDYMASAQAKKEMEMKVKKDRNLEKIRQWRIDAEQGQQSLFEDDTKVYSKRKFDQELQEIETIHSEASKYINDMNTLKGDPFVRPLAVFYNF